MLMKGYTLKQSFDLFSFEKNKNWQPQTNSWQSLDISLHSILLSYQDGWIINIYQKKSLFQLL